VNLGLSGRLTQATIRSPLTPLFLLTALAVGLVALLTIPREEEPQISVPMVDITVRADGLKAPDAVELVTKPLETVVKAIDGVEHTYSQTQDDRVMVTAGRFAVAIGRVEEARAIATGLANRRPNQSRAYGKLIEADIEMAAKRYPAAIDDLNEAKKMMNLWLVRYALGHAYFQQGDYQAALSEFEECQRRRGEATALFLDDLPIFRYYATVPYWLGRTRELRSMDARTQYQEFLAIRGGAADDPLVIDARRRLAAAR